MRSAGESGHDAPRLNSSSISAVPTPIWRKLAIPGIERRTGVKFEYVPVLLGGIYKATGNMSPSTRFAESRTSRNTRRSRPSGSSAATTSRNSVKILLSGQYADADARRRRGPVRGRVRAVFPRRLSSHVGRAEEDGRSRSVPERFVSSGIDIDRLIARAQQDDVKKKLIDLTDRRGRSRRVRLADLLRRQRDVLRQGSASRRRGIDRRAESRSRCENG